MTILQRGGKTGDGMHVGCRSVHPGNKTFCVLPRLVEQFRKARVFWIKHAGMVPGQDPICRLDIALSCLRPALGSLRNDNRI